MSNDPLLSPGTRRGPRLDPQRIHYDDYSYDYTNAYCGSDSSGKKVKEKLTPSDFDQCSEEALQAIVQDSGLEFRRPDSYHLWGVTWGGFQVDNVTANAEFFGRQLVSIKFCNYHSFHFDPNLLKSIFKGRSVPDLKNRLNSPDQFREVITRQEGQEYRETIGQPHWKITWPHGEEPSKENVRLTLVQTVEILDSQNSEPCARVDIDVLTGDFVGRDVCFAW